MAVARPRSMKARAWLDMWILIGLVGMVACGGDDGATGDIDAAPDGPPPEKAAFDETVAVLTAGLEPQGIAGISLAAVVDGELTYRAGIGVRSRATGEPVTVDTRFLFASATKMITAATVLSLAQDGELDLQGSASAQAPRLQFPDGPVTIHQLLTHTSGICDTPGGRPGPIDDWFATHALPSCGTPPGTLFNYANLNYAALGEVIQTVGGRPFTDAVRERVLVPMNMTATYDAALALAGDHATAYGDGVAYQLGDEPVTRPMFQPFGGLMGSATDLAHFVEGVLAADRALSPASVELLTGAHTPMGWGEGWSYGYGTWALDDFGGFRVVSHAGFYPGWTAWVAWVPERKLGLVLLSNGGSWPQYQWLEARFHEAVARFLGGFPVPEFTTPSSTWVKYVGTYARHDNPADTYQVSLDGNGRAWVTTPTAPQPFELLQIRGDEFSFGDRSAMFWPGPSGRYDYMIFWDFVALRQP